jgi:hypothetical protein
MIDFPKQKIVVAGAGRLAFLSYREEDFGFWWLNEKKKWLWNIIPIINLHPGKSDCS